MGVAFQIRTIVLRAFLVTCATALAFLTAQPSIAADIPQGFADPSFDKAIDQAKSAMLSDPRDALRIAGEAERIAFTSKTIRDRQVAIATAQWLEGEAHVRQNEFEKAAPIVDRALRIVSRLPRPIKLLGDLLLSRGGVETAKPDVAAALSDYQRAHNIFRALGETRSQTIALLSIASLYREAKDYQTALKYYGQALELSTIDPKLSLSIYNNRGNTLNEAGDPAAAVREYQSALGISQKLGSAPLEQQILRNIARAELTAGDVEKAERAIAIGAKLARNDPDPTAAAQFWSVAAWAALERGRMGEAKSLINRVFAGQDLTATPLSFRDNHETAYRIFQRTGDARAALAHLEALKRLDDQATRLAASTNTSLMAARFDYANQDLKIARLKRAEAQKNLEFEKSRAQFQRLIFAGVVGATLIVVSMLIFGLLTIRRSRNEVRAANIDLASTNTALEKALAAKTEFLATTSHEIRTPLNGILGMTQVMLADPNTQPSARDRVSVIHSAGVTMRALVDDILDVAKMETGNMTVENVPFDLRTTLKDVSKLWEEQARGKGLTFAVDLNDCPSMIVGDSARLRQIVFNLLSNALKFTSEGSVTLGASRTDDDQLRITVSDTGIGIPADKAEIIFESFRQVDAGTTRRFGGTGLGLSICRNLSRAMGGDVTMKSVEGEGSTFTVTLPLVLAPEAEASESTTDSHGGGLLIVDRNPITRSMIKALFEPRAATVQATGVLDDIDAVLSSGGVGIVLLDEATVRASEDIQATLQRVATAALSHGAKTVLLWTAPDEEFSHQADIAGVSKIVTKPIAGAALVEMLYPADNGPGLEKTPERLVPKAA